MFVSSFSKTQNNFAHKRSCYLVHRYVWRSSLTVHPRALGNRGSLSKSQSKILISGSTKRDANWYKKNLSAHNQVYFIRWLCLAIFDKRFSICWYIRRLEKTPSPRECIVIILCIYTLCIMCISYYAFTIFLSSKTGFKVSVEYQTFAPRVILMAKEPWLSLTVVLQLKLTFTIGRFHFYK